MQLAGLLDISAPPSDEGDQDAWQREVADKLLEAVGFTLEVRPSNVPNAGLGVFVRGEAAPGTAIALWPGLVYPPDALQRLPGFPNPQLTNDHLVARYDGTVIDAQPVCLADRRENSALWRLGVNPLAVAHRVNHPPPQTPPNLLNAAVEFSPAVRSSAPNLWFDHLSAPQTGQQQQAVDVRRRRARPNKDSLEEQGRSGLRGLAMVSIAPLRDGDELLVAYRFNPKHPTPVCVLAIVLCCARQPAFKPVIVRAIHIADLQPRWLFQQWYHDVDPEESERRWAPLPLGSNKNERSGAALW